MTCTSPAATSKSPTDRVGLQLLRYEIRLTDKEGGFELAHINCEQIESFSERSRTIEQALSSRGKTRGQASTLI
jgi:hypothetical protein